MEINVIKDSVYFDLDTKLYLFPINNLKNCILNSPDFILNFPLKNIESLNKLGISFEIRELLLKKVNLYDSSSAVNSFLYNGKEYWLDKSQRTSLFNLFNLADPDEEFEIVFGDVAIKEKASVLKEFLKALERYAYACFVQTQKHLNAINNIEDPKNSEEFTKYIEECVAYDYTAGYPEKLELK